MAATLMRTAEGMMRGGAAAVWPVEAPVKGVYGAEDPHAPLDRVTLRGPVYGMPAGYGPGATGWAMVPQATAPGERIISPTATDSAGRDQIWEVVAVSGPAVECRGPISPGAVVRLAECRLIHTGRSHFERLTGLSSAPVPAV